MPCANAGSVADDKPPKMDGFGSSGPPQKRFKTFTDEEYQELLKGADNKNTSGCDSRFMKAFKLYLTENGVPADQQDFWTFDDATLDSWLGRFWLGARQKNSKKYKLNSMINFKTSLTRILKENGNDADVSKKAVFKESVKAWKKMEEGLKEAGLATTENAPEITESGRFSSHFQDIFCEKWMSFNGNWSFRSRSGLQWV